MSDYFLAYPAAENRQPDEYFAIGPIIGAASAIIGGLLNRKAEKDASSSKTADLASRLTAAYSQNEELQRKVKTMTIASIAASTVALVLLLVLIFKKP